MANNKPRGELPAPSPAEVLAALDRLLASAALRRAPRSRDFLSYVVTETLAGRADLLSERTVGRRALGLDGTFDGAATASVRVRASRVRGALDRYYAGEGRDAQVHISIPPGRYGAVFTTAAAHPAGPIIVPGVAVVALDSSGSGSAGPVAAALSDALTHRLAQYGHLRIIGPTASFGDVRQTGRTLGVSSVIDGRVIALDGQVRISVRLHSSASGEVMWSAEVFMTTDDGSVFDQVNAWAREVAARLGDVTGLVVREELTRPPSRGTHDEVAARLAFYAYVDLGTIASIHQATTMLDHALNEGQRTAELLAMRAAITNASQAFGLQDKAVALDQAAALAREALALDGGNAHAHLVLGSIAHYRGQWDLAIHHAETAVTISPDHPSYLIGAGNTLSGAGAWDRGGDLIRRAHHLHPGLAGRTHTWLAIGHLVHRDHARALVEASQLPSGGGFLWGPLYRAMALAGLGHFEQARVEAEAARGIRPDAVDDPGAFFAGGMRLTTAQRDHLIALVRAATRDHSQVE